MSESTSSPRFFYSAHALSPRDALVFRTVLRLLKTKLKHRWEYSEVACDLLVAGDNPLAASTSLELYQSLAGITVLVGVTPRGRENYLCLPILPADVQSMLDALGDKLRAMSRENSAAPVLHFNAAVTARVAPDSAPSDLSHLGLVGQRFKLKRWPPQQTLGTPSRLKMATAILAVPISLDALAQRSGSKPSECLVFLSDIQKAGLLVMSKDDSSSKPSLSAQTAQLPVKSAAPAQPVKAGLLSRIRSRLGL